jgi:hypothetical protein
MALTHQANLIIIMYDEISTLEKKRKKNQLLFITCHASKLNNYIKIC